MEVSVLCLDKNGRWWMVLFGLSVYIYSLLLLQPRLKF